MLDTILTIIRSWDGLWQFVFLVFFATLMTLFIVLPLIDGISRFFNESLPVILRGWPEGTDLEVSSGPFTDKNDESDEK